MLPHVSRIRLPHRKNAAKITDNEGEVRSGASSMPASSRTANTFLQTRYGWVIKISLTEENDRVHRTIISVYPGAFSFIARWLLKSNKGATRSLPSPDSWWALIYSCSLRNIINAASLLGAGNYASQIAYWWIDVHSANDRHYPFILCT